MVLKLRKSISPLPMEDEKEHERDNRKKTFSKVEALYVALMCFATYCLSSIALEAGGRTSSGNTMTKSAAYNALFRRTYNLKIIILVKNIVTGLISTVMMTLGDKYGIPYLYLPWLVNTMKGMALCEGPALLNLVYVLLSNLTLPAGTFMLVTFFLYVEELFIWSDSFSKFRRCWKDYHYQKQSSKEKLFATRNKKLFCQGDAENKLGVAVEKLKTQADKLWDKSNNPNSLDNCLRPIKSNGDNSNLDRNQFLDLTG